MRWKVALVIILIIGSGIVYYYLTDYFSYQNQTLSVSRVIDGDTLVLENNERCRLLGINTPEKAQPGYAEATLFLRELVEGKNIQIQFKERDKYDRLLCYVFYNGKFVNKDILEKGLATLYVYTKDKYYSELAGAEAYARTSEIGLWKKSSKFGCIDLMSLKYKDNGNCNNQEQMILQNNCESMSIILKDDANHIYDETISSGMWEKNFSCIWNDAGDSVYVRDNDGLLMFYRY